MIKKIILLLFVMSCNSIYAQYLSFSFDGVKLVCQYQINDQQINERILLKNETKRSIYVPILADTSINFFILKETIYSNFGIKNSILGAPNLGGKVLLKEVKRGDSIKVDIVVICKGQYPDEYQIGLDYIKEIDIKKRKVEVDEKNNKIMSTKDYLLNCKSFYYEGDSLGKRIKN